MESKPRPSTAPVEGREELPEILHDNEKGSVAKSVPDGYTTADKNEEPTYPPLRTVALVMAALYLAMFLVSLVRS